MRRLQMSMAVLRSARRVPVALAVLLVAGQLLLIHHAYATQAHTLGESCQICLQLDRSGDAPVPVWQQIDLDAVLTTVAPTSPDRPTAGSIRPTARPRAPPTLPA